MSIDLLPFTSFALQSRPAPALAAEGQTLTLQLRSVPGTMSGRLVVREAVAALPETVRLRVAVPPHVAFTFTRD
jgi:hypothetical protein